MAKFTVATRSLTLAETRLLLQDSLGIFANFGSDEIQVEFGTVRSDDLSYSKRRLRIGEIAGFLEDADRSGDYEFGENDVYLTDSLHDLEIMLNHESHVQASSEDAELVERIRERWLGLGFKGHINTALPEAVKWRYWGPSGSQPDTKADYEERMRNDPERPRYLQLQTRQVSDEERRRALRCLCDLLTEQGVKMVKVFLVAESVESPAPGGVLGQGFTPMAPSSVLQHLERAEQGGFRLGSPYYSVMDITERQWDVTIADALYLETEMRAAALRSAITRSWEEQGLNPRRKSEADG